MLSAYRALERGDRPGVVGAWLTTIARNECRDLIGRRRVEVPLPDALPSGTSDPADVVERRERMRELRSDLAELPDGQRTAIVLRSMGGMRHSEIAAVVGGSEQAARTLVYEARESLAEFAEGRALGCADVRARIDSGDGRALRARRVRAHIRVCEGCRAAAGTRRTGKIAGLIPVPAFLAALRGLFAGGPLVPVAGGAALVSLITAGALVVPGPWNPAAADAERAPAPAAPVLAPAPVHLLAPAAAQAVPGRNPRDAAAPRLAPGTSPAPGAVAPVTGPAAAAPVGGVTPGAAATTPTAGAPAGSGTGTGTGAAAAVRVNAPGVVSATVGGGGVDVDVPAVGVGVSAGGDGVAITSPAANVSVRPPSSGIVPAVDATVDAVSLPRVTVPSVTVPSVPVPSVGTAPVSTPEITTPEVAVPSQIATPEIAGVVPGVTVDLEGTPRIRIGG
jgi:RNA polymerase sigma factor (sigma-70 family)